MPAKERLARLKNLLHRLPLDNLSHSLGEEDALSEAKPDQQADYWVQRLPLIANILGLEIEENDLTLNMPEDLRRDNVLATIKAIILHESLGRPTLILLEDTHWSDELSLELAHHLARDMSEHAIFLVLVHRPLSDPVPLAYQSLAGLSYVTKQALTDLDPEARLTIGTK